MKTMHWTTNKPTEEGWYWYKDKADLYGTLEPESEVIYVYKYKNTLVAWRESCVLVEDLHGMWSSPAIPMPEEADGTDGT